LEHEVPQEQERENVLPSAGKESAAETGTFGTGLRQKQLTELMRINASTMSEFIGHLESDGYVERNVDPSDKRATLITLTEKGRARACELQDERKEKMNQLFSPLTEEERTELFRLLNKLQRRAEE
jgi:DNA-binding MarR family transcriptional regulator